MAACAATLAVALAALAPRTASGMRVTQGLDEAAHRLTPYDDEGTTKCPESTTVRELTGLCECDGETSQRCFEELDPGVLTYGCITYRFEGFIGSDQRAMKPGCATCVCKRAQPEIENDDDDDDDEVVVDYADEVALLRQGKREQLASDLGGKNFTIDLETFTGEARSKEYVVTATAKGAPVESVDMPLFVGFSPVCGVGPFTTAALECRKMPKEEADELATSVARDFHSMSAEEVVDRAFGVEFEMVAREVPEALARDVKAGFKEFWAGGPAEFPGSSAIHEFIGQFGRSGQQEETPKLLQENDAFNLTVLKECSVNATADPDQEGKACASTSGCPLTQFCMDCAKCEAGRCAACSAAGTKGVCRSRWECKLGWEASGQACPVPLGAWEWTSDITVEPWEEELAEELSPNTGETQGVGFELVSPGPPHVLAGREGMRSVLEVLATLRRMGVQAGPSSGLHVHVNVASDRAPGKPMTPRQVAQVWLAYAKYQLVIDEVLSPGRQESPYAKRLFLGDCPMRRTSDAIRHQFSDNDYCSETQLYFRQLHDYVQNNPEAGDFAAFCNSVLAIGSDDKPCFARYPEQRYFQLNLVPLVRLGTVEFRAHSATYETQRVYRWVQFAVAFVEHFGADASETAPFLDGDVGADLADLAEAQKSATFEDLFSALGGKVSADTRSFFKDRAWEAGGLGCVDDLPEGLGAAGERVRAKKRFERGAALMQTRGGQFSAGPTRA